MKELVALILIVVGGFMFVLANIIRREARSVASQVKQPTYSKDVDRHSIAMGYNTTIKPQDNGEDSASTKS